ncbi:hypothetical protein AURDEDRAFT_162408 [Auricularia subglabra TFB-10046 SS5]|nr:hypothetical protein AURDEDRAFT_162408 [Auricularia subglabra TFB-10046 SS5]
MQTEDLQAVVDEHYLRKIKSSLAFERWNRLAVDPAVSSALSAVTSVPLVSGTSTFYGAVAHLLNRISRVFLDGTDDNSQAIVFSSLADKDIPNDYFCVRVRPDLIAVGGTRATLEIALQATAGEPYTNVEDWSHIIGVGVIHAFLADHSRCIQCLSSLKRYRPDFATVHGLLVADGQVSITSLDPRCSWASMSTPICSGVDSFPSVDTWIAYVVLLYQTHTNRDTRFIAPTTNASDSIRHWKVTPNDCVSYFRPLQAYCHPWKSAWLAFEVEPSSPPPRADSPLSLRSKGFLKASWQPASSKYTESYFLKHAHRRGWLPGLVRHRSCSRDASAASIFVEDPEGQPRLELVKEIIHLASVGQPLSQCRSALHFLKVIYDAAETHYQLLRLGIIHRDLSWFNLLCFPWHDETTLLDKPVASDIPCVDFILTGDKQSQPSALVLDLDHAALMQKLYTDDGNRGKERVGTPMFISIELSSKAPMRADSTRSLADITERLRVLDGRPELFARAFPNGDNDFIAKFLRIVKLEKTRIAAGEKAYTQPMSFHRPQHEVESLYWVLVWGFSRACPLGLSPHGTMGDALSQFAVTMLYHSPGVESGRSTSLYSMGLPEGPFHPLLRRDFVTALQDLATYLAVPWGLYLRDVHPDHAHVALRRILLPLIDDVVQGKVADVPFNTTQPRTLQSYQFCLDRASPVTPPPQPLSPPPSAELATNVESPGSPTGLTCDNDALDNLSHHLFSERGPTPTIIGAKRAIDDGKNKPAPKRAKAGHAVEPHPRDVDALIKMLWADRDLWFGTGFHSDADVNTVNRTSAV